MRVIHLIFIVLLISCKSGTGEYDRFTGRWSLHIVEQQQDALSAWEPRKGTYDGRQGFIIYDGKGGMGVHHVPAEYQEYVMEGQGGIANLTEQDLRHLANNFVYFGRYEVDQDNHQIHHHIESANNPASWNSTVTRNYVFSGDTLTLYPVTDTFPKSRLKWVRIND